MYIPYYANFALLIATGVLGSHVGTVAAQNANKTAQTPFTIPPQAAALLFDEDGTVRLMTRSGKILDFACKQERTKNGSPAKTNCAAQPPVAHTVAPPTVKRNAASDSVNALMPAMATAPAKQCMTFFYNAGGGELKAYEYCW